MTDKTHDDGGFIENCGVRCRFDVKKTAGAERDTGVFNDKKQSKYSRHRIFAAIMDFMRRKAQT